ncbi:MAG TPA: hypothetical protein VLD67_22035 [Vicinamibacterales bacterium]|nr:hypothetical protein [Vicinamibacterales bacterium]
MKRIAIGLALGMVGALAAPQWTGAAGVVQAPALRGAVPGQTTTWYFYKVRWGFQDEFLDLFQKNHYPVLKARMDAGYYASIRTYQPRYHGDGRADWTFAVELVVREGAAGVPTEEEVIGKLYPDQTTFRREERRRFELLEAHWDVPLTPVDFESRRRN